jgi:EAL and modified HD-GYP domain-containing signal transduction protein
MLKEIQSVENKELIKNCLVRGKLMDLIATELGSSSNSLEFFMTGVFSSIDVLLSRSMKDIVDELPLSASVREALLGRDNELRRMLNYILLLEAGSWTELENNTLYHYLNKEKYMLLYIESLKWAMELEY